LLEALIPRERFEPWFRSTLDVGDGRLELRRISPGHTNEIILVSVDEQRWVVRRPARVSSPAIAKGMGREFRVLRALDGTAVPHPAALAFCDDPQVVGAPFMVLAFVEGIGATLPLPEPFAHTVEAQRELANGLIDALATVAPVDWQAVGLDGFGKPDGFLDRQVSRWMSQLEQYRTRPIPHLDEVTGWLQRHTPSWGPTGIIHGDYQWNNVLFGADRPGRVVAIVDWEQSTIGDPLLDLGWLLGLWYEPGEDAVGRSADRLFCQLPGLPTRRDLAERYATLTGLDLDNLGYYSTLALFKLACVIEGSYTRYLAGASDDPLHATFEVRVPALVERALSFAQGALI
jgi:aminoglycoside phosphotransferase (APT) family kinase protein